MTPDTTIFLQTDDNANESGLCYDQPPAPSADLLCVLKHLATLQRVCEQYAAVIPQPSRTFFKRAVKDAA